MSFNNFLITLLVLCFNSLYAQDTTYKSIFTPNTKEIIQLNVESNIDEKVTIANLYETKINEAPGSVYIITSEEIDKRGYKDLIEVFANVPGFNISTDVQNGTGLTLRGAWANEAKLLFMIDGMIMNDMSYGSFVLGGRIPLLNIERIEIIKGASSTIYGGIAGLGVINIITKSGKSSKGSNFMVDGGFSNKALTSIRLAFANTTYLLNDFEVSVCGSVIAGNKSNELYTQADSSETNYKDSSDIAESFVQMKLKRKGLEYKIIYNDYNFQATHERITSLCRTFINDLSYTFKVKKFNIDLNWNSKDQIPWNTQYGDPLVYDLQNLKTRRYSVFTKIYYEINNNVSFILGGNYYNDFMKYYRQNLVLNNGSTSQSFNAAAAFAEITLTSRFANIYVGGRYDYYQSFKPNFSPRASITKEFKHFHYKLIYGQSFKIPTLQNINLAYLNSDPLVPEKINDVQIEAGFRNKNQQLKVGAFYTNINNIIVFGYDYINKIESYVNNGNISFAGYEVQLKNVFKKFEINSSYSNYNLISESSHNYAVDTANLSIGVYSIPKHKIVISPYFKLNKKNGFSLNYIYQSEKFGVEQINSYSGEYGTIRYKPTHLIDAVFHAKDILKFFDVKLGIKNILNTKNYYVYAQASGYPTSIGIGRELFIQIKINL